MQRYQKEMKDNPSEAASELWNPLKERKSILALSVSDLSGFECSMLTPKSIVS